ncbi:PREDICTED: diacylglycerol kinase [Prunus dulcis]|uniref:PREDICTED: diacylglycerol kinase n=1 Tax=Prunus dulcis TaxID=3755 RepID=A0A5E4FNJ3_PRUDU|nr:PREDICTED: diacylglycerol kinase [Prunus dulcis]
MTKNTMEDGKVRGDTISVCGTYRIKEVVSNVISKCDPNNTLHLKITLLIISLKEDPPLYEGSIHIKEVTPTNPSCIDDGRLEVVGSKSDFWYGGIDWPLLDQVRGIRFEFIEGAGGVVDLRIDEGMSFGIRIEDLVEIEISYHGQVNILALPDCAAKSIHHSTQSSVSQANAKD